MVRSKGHIEPFLSPLNCEILRVVRREPIFRRKGTVSLGLTAHQAVQCRPGVRPSPEQPGQTGLCRPPSKENLLQAIDTSLSMESILYPACRKSRDLWFGAIMVCNPCVDFCENVFGQNICQCFQDTSKHFQALAPRNAEWLGAAGVTLVTKGRDFRIC